MLFSVPFPLTEIKAAETGSGSTYLSTVTFENVTLEFDKTKLDYSFTTAQNAISLSCTAEDAQSKIQVFSGNEQIGQDAAGSVANQSVTLCNDSNTKIYISVTSSNQKENRVYEFNISKTGAEERFLYLSDLDWIESETSNGDNNSTIKRDKSNGGNPITLKKSETENEVFEKGIGAHASCAIVYDISGLNCTKFSTYVGIDREITKTNEPSASFKIYGDDISLVETGEKEYSSVMEKLEINIPSDTKKIKLEADAGTNEWSDHVDFADAKLTTTMVLTDTYTVRYQSSNEDFGIVSAKFGDTPVNGAKGAAAVKSSETLTLTAEANSGYAFSSWVDAQGRQVGTENVLTVENVDANQSYIARFKNLSTEPVTINAADYQPDTEHGNDWALAIRQMIDDAKNYSGPVTIRFPKGTYDLYPDKIEARELYISNTVGTNSSYKMKKIGFLFEDMENVTVEGNGSTFMFHGKMTTFSTINSTNIKFQNLEFDFKVPTVIDITVEEIDRSAKTAIVSVPECYNYSVNGTTVTWKSDNSPYTGETYWTTTNGMNYTQICNINTNLTWRGGNQLFTNNLTKVEDIGNHQLKFTYSGLDSGLEIGNCYQMRPTVRDHAGMFFWKSRGVTLENIGVHFLHGFGIVGQHSEDISLDHVIFDTPEGSGRTTVGYADFIQMSGCKGTISIRDCNFANPHDDPINVHGTFMKVVERISDRKFKVSYQHNETAGFPNFFVGDQVEFMTQGNMITVPNSVATVTEVQGPTGDSGASESGSGSLTDIIITLDKDIPAEVVANTHVVENITYTPSVVIENNIFRETPTRGILVTTRQPVSIKNNSFDGMGMASIYISNDAQGWWESGPVRDVTIEGNTFTRPNAGHAAIFIEPTNPTVSTTATVHENIKILNNDFYMQNGQVLNAKSVKDLSFTGNRIYRQNAIDAALSTASDTWRAGAKIALLTEVGFKSNNSKLYSFNGCKNVTINNNTYDGGLNLRADLSNMEASDLTIGANEGVQTGKDNMLPPELEGEITVRFESSDTAVVKINADGKTATGLKAGEATIKAYMKVGDAKEECIGEVTLTITAPIEAAKNAYLSKIEFGTGVSLDDSFYCEKTEYTGDLSEQTVTLSLEAEQSNAKIQVFMNNEKEAEKTGSLTNQTLTLSGKQNTKLYICVISPDESERKVYEFDLINSSARTYLSDMDFSSGTVNGYGEIKKNKSLDGNDLRLLDSNGKVQTFAKGLGAHASCNIIYDLAGKGYTDFSVYVGIDREGNNNSSATFEIYGDDVLLAQTEEMVIGTPMEFISVPIQGVRTLRLTADKGASDANDHVDFADAKVVKKDTFTIRYQSASAEQGTVTSNKTGMIDGIAAVKSSETLTLTAQPKTGYVLEGWYNAAGEKVGTAAAMELSNVKANASYEARFKVSGGTEEPQQYTISYHATPSKAATVSAASGTIESTNGSILVKEGDDVTLKAVAAEGYTFNGWYDSTGKQVGTTAEVTIQNVRANAEYEARLSESGGSQTVEEAKDKLDSELTACYDSIKTDGELEEYPKNISKGYLEFINAVLSEAEDILNDSTATLEELNAAIAKLKQAETAAEKILEDGPTLQAAIENAEKTSKNDSELASYPESVKKAYQSARTNALSNVQGILDDVLKGNTVTEESIDTAVAELTTAVEQADVLLTKSDTLKTGIAAKKQKNTSGYTAASVSSYKKKLSEIEAVFTKEEITIADIEKALEELETVEKLLVKENVKVPQVNKSNLLKAITEANKVKLGTYTKITETAFRNALAKARTIYSSKTATQKDVDNATTALTNAQIGLKKDTTLSTPKLPSINTVFEYGGLSYKITDADAKTGTVMLIKSPAYKKAKLEIPDTVSYSNITYTVTAIDKNAFQKNKKLTTVIIGANVSNIGTKAFYKSNKIKSIHFKGTNAPKLGKNAFKGIKSNCTVITSKKMKAKILKKFKKDLKKAGISSKARYKRK